METWLTGFRLTANNHSEGRSAILFNSSRHAAGGFQGPGLALAHRPAMLDRGGEEKVSNFNAESGIQEHALTEGGIGTMNSTVSHEVCLALALGLMRLIAPSNTAAAAEASSSERLSGTIREPGGAPAPSVLVSFHPGHYPGASSYVKARTDANGRYELPMTREAQKSGFWWGPVDRTNSILARSLERNLVAIREFEAKPTELDLTLEPGLTLSGSVKDTQGAPVATALVNVSTARASGGVLSKLNLRPAQVDAQGSFAFPALPQGSIYDIEVSGAAGYGSAARFITAEQTRVSHYDLPVFVLKRADRKLAGQVFGPEGQPVAGAEVSFTGTGQPDRPTTLSDSTGGFVFDAVCEGEVFLNAHSSGPPEVSPGVPTVRTSRAGLKARAGDTNIIIQLHDPNYGATFGRYLTTTGRVLDPSGAPAPRASLKVWSPGMVGETAQSDAYGNYVLCWQRKRPFGGARLVRPALVARDAAPNLAATHGFDETTTNLDLRLQAGVTVKGAVRDAENRPLADARVDLGMRLNHVAQELEHASTDAQGSFTFKGLPQEADYFVNVNAMGYALVFNAAAEPDSAQPDQLKVPHIKLVAANLPVAGKVVGPDGKPIPGLWIYVDGGGAMTDAEGRFVFQRAAPGRVGVRALKSDPDGGPDLSCRLEVQAGDTNVLVRLEPENGIGARSPGTNPPSLESGVPPQHRP
jgi:protocatechuate 3,4-dioxygenase beta subunit